ncbi:uncharacterized protein LOC135946876 [Cloeon dipterum]|uniref:Uncharacterized protein n=1 Tax=Cloeon dipterum TaxID=197152 RepID=A0A8S1C0K2_9INSE|nr:Hypothetical predicted protein [Cloeon dipterum]
MIGKLLLLVAAGVAVVAASPLDNLLQQSPNLRLLHRVYSECEAKGAGMSGCLKARAVSFVDKVSRMDTLPLADHLSLVRTHPEQIEQGRQSRALTEGELEAADDQTLTDTLVRGVTRVFSGRTIQFEMPKVSEEEVQRSLEEGRGKMKKMMGSMMMMAGMMKMGLLMLLKVKALFFLAKKALIISKIALFLALAVIIKKLLSSQDSGWQSSGGWSSGGGGGGHGGGWDRTGSWDAHNVAYKAHRP